MVDLLSGAGGDETPAGPVEVGAAGEERERGGGPPARTVGHAPSLGSRRPAALSVLALFVLLALRPACATGGPEPGADGPAPERPAEEEDADAGRRAASDRLVESGREALEEGRLETAAGRIERAVRLDPSNGRSYLALAEVRVAAGRPGEARGLIERALTLLEPGSPPAARADSLRAELDRDPD